jgi:hypothetical protein
VDWTYASRHLHLLLNENRKRGRISVHADILNERHTSAGLGLVLPIDEFVAADFFLFLKRELPPDGRGPFFHWYPWSTLHLKGRPIFLFRAESASKAEELARVLGVPSVPELKRRLKARAPHIRELFATGIWFFPINEEVFERIGSRTVAEGTD